MSWYSAYCFVVVCLIESLLFKDDSDMTLFPVNSLCFHPTISKLQYTKF